MESGTLAKAAEKIGGGNLTKSALLAKWNNLSVPEAKSLYAGFTKTEIKGSKTTVKQSIILAELESSKTLVNPYSFAHSIDDIVLSSEAVFVRVHNSWNPNRPWIVAVEDFHKFTSQDDLIKKLALPIVDNTGVVTKPVEMSLVKIPSGTIVRKSVARPQSWPGQGNQPGGAIQFEIRGADLRTKENWFKSLGKTADYLK